MSLPSPERARGSRRRFKAGARFARVPAATWLRPPRRRSNEPGATARRATWLELFYDLGYVVAVAALAERLSGRLDPVGALAFAALFVPVWWSWAAVMFYNDRFDTDDLWHRAATLLQMLGAALLAVNVHSAFVGIGFPLAYALVRAILVVKYVRVARHAPTARPLAKRYAVGFGLAAALWAASILVPAPARFAVWVAAMAIDLGTPLTARAEQSRLPVSESHLPERIGLFTIIVLGESVAAVVRGAGEAMSWPAALAAGAMGLALAFGLWWIYFENLDARVVRRSRAAGQAWLFAHLPLCMGLAMTGVGVERLVVADGAMEPAARWVLGGGLALCLASMALIHVATLDRAGRHPQRRRAVVRLATAGVILLVTALSGLMPPLAFGGVLAALGVAQVALDPPARQAVAAS